jgi:predicted metal-binding membrane protein
MNATSLEGLLKRDRRIVAGALAAIAIMAWGYVLWLAEAMRMPGMEGAGVRMDANPLGPAMLPHDQPWGAVEFALMFAMWTIMMVGMMVPSSAPMVLLYARVGRQAMAQGRPIAGAWWFLGGYLVAWTLFALGATAAQWSLERAALLSGSMASTSSALGAVVLLIAGLYQFTPAKTACLSKCQAPLAFIQRHGGFRRDPRGALALGLRHGAYCVGCCWALMALLFVVGVMNVLWVAGIAIFALLERILPASRTVSRIGGIGLIAAAVSLLVQ